MSAISCAPTVKSATAAAAKCDVPEAARSTRTTLEDQQNRAGVAAVLATPDAAGEMELSREKSSAPGMAEIFRSPEGKAAFGETAHEVARQTRRAR